MSHLAHIVKLKKDLIDAGVTSPAVQVEVVQTAYVKALITQNVKAKLNEDQCIDFNRYVLSYWNETTPNAGHAILVQIGNFFRKLAAVTDDLLIDNSVKLEVTPAVKDAGEAKYTELASYRDLIQTLVDEANHKLQHFLAVQ